MLFKFTSILIKSYLEITNFFFNLFFKSFLIKKKTLYNFIYLKKKRKKISPTLKKFRNKIKLSQLDVLKKLPEKKGVENFH